MAGGVYPISDSTAAYPVITANGRYPSPGVMWGGGTGSIEVVGTFGGGTVKLQKMGQDGTTLLDLGSNTTFTAPGIGGFIAPAGMLFLSVSGATSPSIRAIVSAM